MNVWHDLHDKPGDYPMVIFIAVLRFNIIEVKTCTENENKVCFFKILLCETFEKPTIQIQFYLCKTHCSPKCSIHFWFCNEVIDKVAKSRI